MHTRFHVFTLRALGVLGLLLSGGAFAEEPSLQARLDQVIEKALADKRIVGAVVLVAQDGQVVYHRRRRGGPGGPQADARGYDLPTRLHVQDARVGRGDGARGAGQTGTG